MEHAVSPTPRTILVTGASGHLGRLIVYELLSLRSSEGGEGRVNVVAASRNTSALGDMSKMGAELRLLDLDSFDLTREAFEGIDVVILVSTMDLQRRVFQHRTAIRAAEASGVSHLLYTSFVNPRPQEGIFNDHFFTEMDLAHARLRWTILRNNSYAETLLLPQYSQFIRDGVFPTTSEREGRRAYICRADCAAMAAHTAMNAERFDHRILDVAADQALSSEEIAMIFGKIAGTEVKTECVTQQEYTKRLEGAKTPDWWMPVAQDLEAVVGSGALAITNGGMFKEIVGRPPTSLEAFLQEHKHQLLNPYAAH